FLDIKFERKQQKIVGGRIRTFLLERSRVAYQPPTERNYHIFYQLLAGASPKQREEFHIGGEHASWQAFHYTRQGGEGSGVIAGVNDADDFGETDASLEMVGIDAKQRSDIWRTLAGILHLGNVGFAGSESMGSYVDTASEKSFAMAAELMGVSEAKLRQWLTKRQIVTRHDNILAKVNKAQALVIRDSIAKFVYSRLFDWILGPINKSILPTEVDERLTLFVGVLDIYGFEHFVHNSFEQFCINYANEKLQQNFNHHVFKLEQEEYKREQLKNWTFIGFQDNQPCIDLIEGRMGILALLDEESRLEQGSDRTFTEKLYRQFDLAAPNGGGAIPPPTAATAASCEIANYFRKPRFSNTAFTVKHYAHDVTYEGDGFLEKNKDTVPDEILDLLCSSSFELVASLAAGTSANANATAVPSAASALSGASPRPMAGVVAAGIANLESGRNSPVVRPASPALGPSARGRNGNGLQRRQAPTLAGVFKRSLTGLMVTLAETEMHYIRCIKPNEAKKAWEFQAPMVLSQLRSCGVIETIRISKAGYPSRVPIRTFNERYTVLLDLPPGSLAVLGGPKSSDVPDAREQALCKRILATCMIDEAQFQIGLTKVFFRAGQWAIMEKKRSALFEKSAMVIQRFCRGSLIRRSYREMNVAATKIQRWYRKHLFTTQVENFRRRHAVRVVERRWIELCQHRKFVKEAQNAQRIQALCRGFLTRKRFSRMVEMHHMEETARLRDEAERARQAVDKERMRADQARRGADDEKIRASTQAARSKAQMAAAEQVYVHRGASCNSVVTHGLLAGINLDDEPEDPASYDEYMAHVPVGLRSNSDFTKEPFARLTIDTQQLPRNLPSQPTSPTALGSYADMRRISTQSNEATRRRTAEARASLIAAATAGRNAEAELVRQQPSNGSSYSMYSSTACSPSYNGAQQRNAFGFQDGANISQQLQQIPEGTSPHVSKHRHQDSLTVGDDIFSIINEMSPVSDSRYGEVASRLQGQREPIKPTHPPSRYPASISPPPTVDYSVPPNSNGSENNKYANVQGYRRSVIVSNDSQNLIQQQQQQQRDVSSHPGGMSVTPRSRAASRLAEQSQNRRSWLMDALKSSHSSPTAFVAAAAITTVVVVDHGKDMTPPDSSTHESLASAAEEATPGSFRRKNIPVIRELSSQRNSQILTPQQQEQQEVALTAALGLLEKRESRESLKKATTLVSGDIGGRHTAARARAWASKTKDRMFSAFSGGERSLKGSHSSTKSIASIKGSAESNRSFDDSDYVDPLEPPTRLRYHHQTQSATNVMVTPSNNPSMLYQMANQSGRPPTAGSLKH
ncbi:Myosin type-2 heavy chain 1, partial [Kickxella alabastrina]